MIKRLNLIFRIFLGGLFIFSAIAKLKSTGQFEIVILEQGIVNERAIAAYLTRIIIGFEFFIGLSFFQPYLIKRFFSSLLLLTLVGFTTYLIFLLFQDRAVENCGCFGEIIRVSTGASIIKNLFLMGIVVFIMITYNTKPVNSSRVQLIPILIFIASILLVVFFAPFSGLNSNLFANYTEFSLVGRVDLLRGEYLIVVMNADCEHCKEAATELGELSRKIKDIPQIYYLLFAENSSSVDMFFVLTDTHYPYHLISESEFFNLIGSQPPRFYWLRNGEVLKYWDNNLKENIDHAFLSN
jgi:hypothetical protein